MNRILQLQQDRQAKIDAAKAILALAATEKRMTTADEDAAFSGFETEANAITALLDKEQRMAALSNIPSDRGRAPAEVHDNSLRAPFGPEARAGETPKERKLRLQIGFGHQLLAMRKHAMWQNGGSIGPVPDARLIELQNRAAAAGASEAVPADGGFLVAPDYSTQIVDIAHDTGQVFTRARKLPMSAATNALKIPGIDEQSRADGSRWGGIRMYWENEADSLTGSKPKFRLIELVTKKLTGLFYATDELLQDAAALGAVVQQGFGEEMGFKLDDGCIRGTGSGQLQGILNAPCLVSVSKETGQAAATIVYENIKKMWGRMYGRSRLNSVWFINQDCEQQLNGMVQVVGTAGAPVYLPPGGASAQPYGMLYGRPVIPIEQCDTVGTQGDIILADFCQYLMVDKGDMQQAVSMHVQFLTSQQTFRYVYRVDGQPQWHTALTPFKGSNTLSPFVALNTRA